MESNEKQKDNEAYFDRVLAASIRIGFVAFLFFVSYIIIKPFLLLVVWGIIIAVGIYPIFQKLSKLLGNKDKLAATIISLLAIALIIVPSVLMLDSTITSVQNAAAEYEAGTLVIPSAPAKVAEWPVIGKPTYEIWQLASTNIEAAIKSLKPQIKEYGPKLIDAIAGLGGTILFSILSIIIAGVLLLQAKSGEKAAQSIFKFLVGKDGEQFTNLTTATIKSVVQGVLGIAIVQSIASGILLVAFGIPAAGLWALIVLILAIIQLPPTLILLPIAIYGFSIMDTTPAIIFLILSIIVSAADTFLKPIFLGRGVDVPMLVILLGAIGGMIAFGILGLFIGSVILAIAYKVFQALINNEL